MRNRERAVIALLMIGISLITLALGSLMHYANLKATVQNTIGVELADFQYNIRYSMQFGKQIETFYGMDDRLQEEKERFPNIYELYILGADHRILFSTGVTVPGEDIVSMPAGENKTDHNVMYCMYPLHNESRILVCTGLEGILEQEKAYVMKLAVKAAAETAIAVILMMVLSILFRNQKRAAFAASAVMLVWILVFGITIGVEGYQTYSDSVKTVVGTIQNSVDADFAKIESLGVPREQIHEVDRYLERYLDMVPEIEEIHIEQGSLQYKTSASYLGKTLMDYVLQTVLLLTFSILLLAEYRIFIKNYRAPKTEVQHE